MAYLESLYAEVEDKSIVQKFLNLVGKFVYPDFLLFVIILAGPLGLQFQVQKLTSVAVYSFWQDVAEIAFFSLVFAITVLDFILVGVRWSIYIHNHNLTVMDESGYEMAAKGEALLVTFTRDGEHSNMTVDIVEMLILTTNIVGEKVVLPKTTSVPQRFKHHNKVPNEKP